MKKVVTLVFSLITIIPIVAQDKIDTTIVYFDIDSHHPNNEINWEFNDSVVEILIIAFTDTTGSYEHNKSLAKNRAMSVLSNIDTINFEPKIKTSFEGETSKFGELEKNRCVLIISKLIQVEKEKIEINFQFISGTATLRKESIFELEEYLDSIKEFEFSKIEIHGHVCCSDNYQLSLDRAHAVKDQFINKGINQDIINCFGHSNKYPIVEERTYADMQKNRRVEVLLIRKVQ